MGQLYKVRAHSVICYINATKTAIQWNKENPSRKIGEKLCLGEACLELSTAVVCILCSFCRTCLLSAVCSAYKLIILQCQAGPICYMFFTQYNNNNLYNYLIWRQLCKSNENVKLYWSLFLKLTTRGKLSLKIFHVWSGSKLRTTDDNNILPSLHIGPVNKAQFSSISIFLLSCHALPT